MAAAAEVTATLVDKDGNFNANIVKDLKLDSENCPVAAVSIIGVQSTGKSTLLNKCFSTNFREMDPSKGMSQTTKGICIAKWASPSGGPKILVIDIEGSDSSERQDDDRFEKKTALFALAMSNTLIFNMKCDNVNLRYGASRPLLKTVLQAMLRKFSTPRQVNLVFVLRDKNMCPLDSLRKQLIEGIKKIWRGLSKNQSNVNALENYFNIEVMVMSHYRHEKQEFEKEVGNLRELVMTLVQNGQRSATASSFTALAEKNWNDIKEDKILNLQLNKITVDGVICHEIADKKYKNFRADESWAQIKDEVNSIDKLEAVDKVTAVDKVEDFGKNVDAIISKYLKEYDEETLDTDESKRIERRKELIERMLEDVERIHLTLVENMRKAKLESFRKDLVPEIKGDRLELVSTNRKKVINEFTALLNGANIKEANWNHRDEQLEKLKSELVTHEEGAGSIVSILKQMETDAFVRNGLAGLGFAASIFTGPLMPGVAGLIPPAVTSLSTIIAWATNAKKIDEELKDARRRNPAVGALWKLLDRA